MFGLIVLAALGLYLVLLIGVATLSYGWARKEGMPRAKCWAATTCGFLLVYLPIFWDHVPTIVMHKLYCDKEAEFSIYKTRDQWKAENPGTMERLIPSKGEPYKSQKTPDGNVDTYFMNQRFNVIEKTQGPTFFHRWRHERTLVDSKTGETLGKYVDFSTSHEKPQAGWLGWKIWLANDHCNGGRENAVKSAEWINEFKGNEYWWQSSKP